MTSLTAAVGHKMPESNFMDGFQVASIVLGYYNAVANFDKKFVSFAFVRI